ncbi:MAG: CRTAC1 family protein [Pirellulaceae bacterium]
MSMSRAEGRWAPSAVDAGVVTLLLVLCLTSCSVRQDDSPPPSDGVPPHAAEQHRVAESGPLQFHDVVSQSGITFTHTHGGSGKRYIIESMSAGLALFDYDNDGDIDVYFLNGAALPGTHLDKVPVNALYRNDGDWKFVDVTEQAGVGDPGHGMGVVAGDYNNDGDLDLYINNSGANVLYHNNGDGTFTDVTHQAGVAHGDRAGAGVCFLDIEGDGDLDLFVSSYVKFTFESNPTHFFGGIPRYPRPVDFVPETNALYRNNGDGTFADVSLESQVGLPSGYGMGITACDYDNDGDCDVVVCNDMGANFLFENDGAGNFTEIGERVGIAFNGFGRADASMGVDSADFDHDGWLDLVMTCYQFETTNLYRNLGAGLFEDIARQAGIGNSCVSYVKWGVGLVDFDNDGDRDLMVATGHTEDLIDKIDDSTSYWSPDVVYENVGNGKFLDVSQSAGDGMAVRASGRGAGFDDLDGDGDVDGVILNSNDRPTILRNMHHEIRRDHHWLQIRCRGTQSNRDGVGGRVTVVSGDLTQIDEVHAGRGYQSHFGSQLHFGLAARDHVDRIEVRWIGGSVDVLTDVSVDRVLTLIEGQTNSP